jgi:hypothetical protein
LQAFEPFSTGRVAARNASILTGFSMSRNGLYALIGILAIIVIVLGGYMLYQQSQQPSLEIKVDSNGIQVNGNG